MEINYIPVSSPVCTPSPDDYSAADKYVIDYSLDNDNLYSKELLNKSFRNLFITIPHTNIDYKILINSFNSTLHLKYIIGCRELHQDNTPHIHLLLVLEKPSRLKPIHNIIKSQNETPKGSINYKTAEHIAKCINYIKKDKDYMELGEVPSKTGSVGKQKQNISYQEQQDIHYTNILEIIENTQDKDKALETFKKTCPRDYFMNSDKVEAQIDKLLKPKHKKYDYIKYTNNNTALSNWQQETWDILQSPPKPRQIIWVYGEPGAGKSFMFNYLTENHEYGLYHAGQSVSLDNLAYSYEEQGVIAWDIPMNFNWKELTTPLCNVIEKFSDFGQIITSKKYTGKNCRVLGHTLVFSNNPPPIELTHRDIKIIIARKPINYKLVNGKYVVAHKISNQSTKYFYYNTEDEMNKQYYIDTELDIDTE